jgi:zinc/manganese transport system substrate-binding protein
MKKAFTTLLIAAFMLAACQSTATVTQDGRTQNVPPQDTAGVQAAKKTIVVTYSILGSVVKDLVGTDANVVVLVPNGQDPHEWEPSAKDIETVNHADFIIQNGLGLEGGLQKTLSLAVQQGIKTFIASEHITLRKVGQGEVIPGAASDQAVGTPDPHLWTDPSTIRQVVSALADQLKSELGMDMPAALQKLVDQLDGLDSEITSMVNGLPEANRKLVTGHDSLGYFADRYGFKLVGAITPSLTSQAEVSAADLAALKTQIQENQVKAIFTELGTPPAIAQAIGQDAGVKVVELSTHTLPADGSYFTFMHNLAQTIVDNLR